MDIVIGLLHRELLVSVPISFIHDPQGKDPDPEPDMNLCRDSGVRDNLDGNIQKY